MRKAWTLAAAIVTLLPLGACTDDAGGAAVPPEPEPGDPAVYAPDGWPLRVGDRVSWERQVELRERFRLPGLPRGDESGPSSAWEDYEGLNLVGDRVYAALFQSDPKLGEYLYVYRGHFPIRFEEWMRRTESHLPPEYHGKVEYYTVLRLPYVPHPDDPIKTIVLDPGMWDSDGRLLKLDPNYVPRPPDPRRWPDYGEGR